MKNFGAKWLALAAVVGAAAGLSLNGCGGGDGGGTGKGGSAGSSAGGRGGTSTAGTGGSAGRGGATAGTGGSTGGSTAGTGGATGGTGGGGGTSGGLPCPGLATFDSDAQGFLLNTYAAAGNLANLEGGAKATLSWTNTQGDPGAGAVKVDAPYSDYNQFVDVQKGLGSAALQNWTGFKMHVRVKVESGLNPSAMNPAGSSPTSTPAPATPTAAVT